MGGVGCVCGRGGMCQVVCEICRDLLISERLVHCSKPLQRPGRARLNKG